MISKAKANGLIYGIKIARQAIAISHLMHVDDLFLFLRVNTTKPFEWSDSNIKNHFIILKSFILNRILNQPITTLVNNIKNHLY